MMVLSYSASSFSKYEFNLITLEGRILYTHTYVTVTERADEEIKPKPRVCAHCCCARGCRTLV